MPNKILLLCLLTLLSSCGFHLREQTGMPFNNLYIRSEQANSPLLADLKRHLQKHRVKLTNSAEGADVVLHIVSENSDKQILSLGGSGRVNEFNLRYRVSLRAYDREDNDWIAADEITVRRDYSYDDTRILAKEGEEGLLIESMRNDMVNNILRRLSRAKAQAE